jgi:hypothetical protein
VNSLSWLIYLGDVVGGADGFAVFLAVVCGLVAGVGAMVKLIATAHGEGDDIPWTMRGARNFALACIAASSAAIFIPSRSTVYAIAASELGERALTTQTGNKAVQALNAWLDRQIKGEDDRGKDGGE